MTSDKPDARIQRAKDKLVKLHKWQADEITLELFALIKEQITDVLLTTVRAPKNTWDALQREQDKGHVKGLAELSGLVEVLRANLQLEADGQFEEESKSPSVELRNLIDLPDSLGDLI